MYCDDRDVNFFVIPFDYFGLSTAVFVERIANRGFIFFKCQLLSLHNPGMIALYNDPETSLWFDSEKGTPDPLAQMIGHAIENTTFSILS